MADDAYSPTNISWLAGLLEGKGCFQVCRNTGRKKGYTEIGIQLVMTDEDVVARAARLLSSNVKKGSRQTLGGKDVYRTNVHGPRAIAWMMTILPLMGARRGQKIRDCIATWKSGHTKTCYAKYFNRYVRNRGGVPSPTM